jgi:hypothetical protein
MGVIRIINGLIPESILDWYQNRKNKDILNNWNKGIKTIPPPHIIKQRNILNIKNKYNLNTLVETGTYMGDMIKAMKDEFSTIYSIELSKELYEKAKKKFIKHEHIHILNGNSGEVLYNLCDKIKEPSIFFLDGHYSAGITAKADKDTPIYEELDAIFNLSNNKHFILIDDARLFNGENDYPTIQELEIYVYSKNVNYSFEVKDDTIFVIPKI